MHGTNAADSLLSSTIIPYLYDLPDGTDLKKDAHSASSRSVGFPTFYLSGSHSFLELHIKDDNNGICNLMRWGDKDGAWRAWLCISPADTLRACTAICKTVQEMSGDINQCADVPHYHKNIVVSPSFLRERNIQFEIIIQRPGDLVQVDRPVYHQVMNFGMNLNEMTFIEGLSYVDLVSNTTYVSTMIIEKPDDQQMVAAMAILTDTVRIENTTANESLESHINPMMDDPYLGEPLQDLFANELMQDPLVDEPVQNLLADEPVQNPLADEPVQDPLVNEQVQDPLVDDLVQDPFMNEPVQDPLVDKPMNDSLSQQPVHDPLGLPSVRPVCTLCNAVYGTIENLKRHYHDAHGLACVDTSMCYKCHQPRSRRNLRRHEKRCRPNPGLCSWCGTNYPVNGIGTHKRFCKHRPPNINVLC